MQSTPQNCSRLEVDLERYHTLIQLADLTVHHQTLAELFHELAGRLQQVAEFEFFNFSLHDPRHNLMRLHTWQGGETPPVPPEVSVEDSCSGWVWKSQRMLVLPDIREEKRFPVILETLRARGIRSYCMFPLTTARGRLGALGFGSARVNAYSESDLQLLEQAANLVTLAVENTLTRQDLNEEKQHLRTLLEINQSLVSNLDIQRMFPVVSETLRRVMHVDYASLAVHDDETDRMRILVRENQPVGLEERAPVPPFHPWAGLALQQNEVKFFSRSDSGANGSLMMENFFEQEVQCGCCIPMVTANGTIGTLNLASTVENAFQKQHVDLLRQIANQIAIALENSRAYQEIAQLKDKLAQEKLYLEDEIRSKLNFEEIIGESAELKRVLAQVETVAPSTATVLLLGETGTGKEVIARAIHRMSARKDNSFVKLNCAAIPTGLLESELFGHEKGAFTGAISRKVGRLEVADKGTLFLDEIGDISLELQPKLLRVLQDQEFERLGNTHTIRVNVRVIAATNQNLAQAVAEKEFRSDLFYRLNVFPVRIPPLRERRMDIPLLVRYFVQKFAHRMDKLIETIPTATMDALTSWDWPGNVRELENFIERSVILSEGSVLRVPLAELRPVYEGGSSTEETMANVQRQHIVRVLRQTGGVIAGPNGAAARLGMKRTTLQSRMQKLGVDRSDYQS